MLKKFFKWLERKSRMASLEVPKGSLTNIDGEVRYPQMYQVTQEYFNGFVRAYKIGLLLRISTKTQYLY